MLGKELEKYERKKVVLYVKANEKAERFYLILMRLSDNGIECIDARGRNMTFSFEAVEGISEMTAKQKEKFDYIRHGKAGIQNDLSSY